jgi:hypothetical protein
VKINEKIQISKNNENNTKIFINYTTFDRSWNRIEIIVDDVFAYNITLEVLKDNEDLELTSIEEYHHRSAWSK